MSVIALSTARPVPAPARRSHDRRAGLRGETSFVVKDLATQKYFRFRPVEVGVMRAFDGAAHRDEIAAALAEQGMRTHGGGGRGLRAQDGEHRSASSARSRSGRRCEMERMRAERRTSPPARAVPRRAAADAVVVRRSGRDVRRAAARTSDGCSADRSFCCRSAALFAVYFLHPRRAMGRVLGRRSRLVLARRRSRFANVVVFWVTGVVVILIHELGHGFACKHFGGEVHELGFMLIYFQPAFYCNVNDAWSFPALRARLWVTAAGGGSSSSSRASPRSCGGPPRRTRSCPRSRWPRCSSVARRPCSRTRIHSFRSTAISRSPTGSRSRTCACGRSRTSDGGCGGTASARCPRAPRVADASGASS